MTRLEEKGLWYKRIKHFNLPGHVHVLTFSCHQRMPLLLNDAWCSWLAESLLSALEKHMMALWAYVFMPEHVHLLVRPRCEPYDISGFLKSAKGSSAKRILRHLRQEQSLILDRLRVRGVSGRNHYCFWQAGPGYDKNILAMDKAVEKANYCHRNPVTRGLVADPGDWKWSSYRSLELGQIENEILPVNSWDEGWTVL
jgi:putative transposase